VRSLQRGGSRLRGPDLGSEYTGLRSCGPDTLATDVCSLTAPDGYDPFADFQSRYGLDVRKDFLHRARVIGAAADCGAYEAL
jgi:hypothetical protein